MSYILDHIINIREVFSLNYNELSYILGINKSELYRLINSSKIPTDDQESNIIYISNLATKVRLLKIHRIDRFLKREMLNGNPLIDNLRNVSNEEECIEVLREIEKMGEN